MDTPSNNASQDAPRGDRSRNSRRPMQRRSVPVSRNDAPTPSTNSTTNPAKQTNQHDRFSRPSLSTHGARRPNTPDGQSGGYNAPRRSTAPRRRPESTTNQAQARVSTSPRITPGRNPKLSDGRPPVSRRPRNASRGFNKPSAATAHLDRRRFTPLINESNGRGTVIGSGSRKLRIIPLGGAGETGAKNMTVFEYGEDIVVIDCGIAFAGPEYPGIDALIPDVTYLEQRKNNIRGMIFTHGHEDHIGSTPYIWPRLQCPMYATPLAAGLIKHKLEEAGVKNANMQVIQEGDKLHFGKLSVEAVRLTHSIPDVLGLAIRCPAGLFFYATDWRLEHTPALGKPADWTRIAQLAGEGITALFSDSTNVDRPGYSPTEKIIGEAFDRVFQEAKGRIIIAQFASNINRVQQVFNSAKKFSRKVALSGRSMETYVNIAMSLGYLSIPEGMLVDLRKVNSIDPHKVAILSTGSQGEEFSSLVRMSEGAHRHIKLNPSDTIVVSASAIPGNEDQVERLLANLYREGSTIINNKVMADVHVSGHPSRDELRMMIALAQPKFFIPIHGSYHRMVEHGKLAVEMGVDPDNILLMENGNVVEFDENGGKLSDERVQLEDIMIDGLGIGDVGSIVIRDRLAIGREGMVTIFMVTKQNGEMVTSPDIISRGFIYMREAEDLMRKLREEIKMSYNRALERHGTNWEEIKQAMRDEITQFIEQNTGRSPMVIPVITTVEK